MDVLVNNAGARVIKGLMEHTLWVNATTSLAAQALAIFSHFCDGGHAEMDYSGISKLIGGEAWDYEVDPSVIGQ